MEPTKKSGKYLDIGAHHPSYLNNTLIFYRKEWGGINVEPLKDNIELFFRERPIDINLNIGIGVESGIKKFYRMDAETLSTFNADVARENETFGHKIVAVEEIKILSVDDFIAEFRITKDKDHLTKHIEGKTYNILKRFFEKGIRPKVMIVETVFYTPDLRDAQKDNELIRSISAADYTLYADTFINSIFIANEFYRK